MLRVACDKEAIMTGEVFLQGGQTVLYRLRSVLFIVDAFWARGCSEVLVCGLLGKVSCWLLLLLATVFTSLNCSASTSGLRPLVICSVEFGLMMRMDRILLYLEL